MVEKIKIPDNRRTSADTNRRRKRASEWLELIPYIDQVYFPSFALEKDLKIDKSTKAHRDIENTKENSSDNDIARR